MSSTKIKIEHFITSASASVVLLGAIYMKFYWKEFGINAFDFASLADIGLATTGQLMMVIYSIIIAIIGISIEIAIRNKIKLSLIVFLSVITIVGYYVSITTFFPDCSWMTEAIGLLSLLSLSILLSFFITKYNRTKGKLNNSPHSQDEMKDSRNTLSYWLVVIVLISMSYLEAIDDSRDVIEMNDYSYVLKKDIDILPNDTMVFIGKIGENYFFKEHYYNNLNNTLIIHEDNIKTGLTFTIYSRY